MRAALGPALAHLALLAAGFGVLALTGHLRPLTASRLLGAVGRAYLAGVASAMTVVTILLLVGVPISIALFALVCAVLAAPVALAVRGVRRPARIRRPRRSARAEVRDWPPERWVLGGLVAVLGFLAVAGTASVPTKALTEYDAWQIWTRKATLLFSNPHLPLDIVQNPVFSTANWDYPLLLPLVEAMQFRAAGEVSTPGAHLAPWLLLVAFVWAGAYLVRDRVRPLVSVAILGGVAVMAVPQALTAYADVPLAAFLGLGALAVGRWIHDGRPADLAIGAILLAGAAQTKNEGLGGALIVLGVALLVHAVGRDWRGTRAAALAGGAVVLLAVLPWRLWLAAHDVHSTTPIGKGLSPGFLADRTGRLVSSVDALYDQVTLLQLGRFGVPIALALIVLRFRELPRVAAFYLAAGVLYFASLVWAYWVSPLDLGFLVATSAGRVPFPLIFLATAAVVHLAREPVRDAARDRDRPVAEAQAPIRSTVASPG